MSVEAGQIASAAAAAAPEHDHAVADLGIFLIVASGLLSGQFIRVGVVSWSGDPDPHMRIDILVLAGEIVTVMVLAVISEMNYEARSVSLALLWGLFAVLMVMQHQAIADNFKKFINMGLLGTANPGTGTGTATPPIQKGGVIPITGSNTPQTTH